MASGRSSSNAPPPRRAWTTRPAAEPMCGVKIAPTTGTPPSSRLIMAANRGTPWRKFVVPSSGSTSQVWSRASSEIVSVSSVTIA